MVFVMLLVHMVVDVFIVHYLICVLMLLVLHVILRSIISNLDEARASRAHSYLGACTY